MEAPDSIGTEAGELRETAIDRQQVRFVLVQARHAGNIVPSALAIRTMGFSGLSVVAPQVAEFRRSPEAVALAANAQDVLRQASAHATVVDALDGVNLAIAMTGYAREFGPPHVELRDAAARAAGWLHAGQGAVAFVFGTERSGLLNRDVQRCQLSCAIGAARDFPSLNLAQAVQVTAYALRGALEAGAAPGQADAQRRVGEPGLPGGRARVEQSERFFEALERALIAIGFHEPSRPRHLMARLRGLFNRAGLTEEELDILLGICAAIVEPKALRAGRKGGRPKAPKPHADPG